MTSAERGALHDAAIEIAMRHAWVTLAMEIAFAHSDVYAPWPTDDLGKLLEALGYRASAAIPTSGCHYSREFRSVDGAQARLRASSRR